MFNQSKSAEAESVKLVLEIEKLKEMLALAESDESEAIHNPDLRNLVLTLITGERVLDCNHELLQKARREIEKAKNAISAKKQTLHEKYSDYVKALTVLTDPVISRVVEDFRIYLERLKVTSSIESKQYNGFSKITTLTVRSNRAAVSVVRKMVSKGMERIKSMHLESITVIEQAATALRREFEAINFREEKVEQIDENDYFRGSQPASSDPNFDGPRSGL